jgi:hypothetical protein
MHFFVALSLVSSLEGFGNGMNWPQGVECFSHGTYPGVLGGDEVSG